MALRHEPLTTACTRPGCTGRVTWTGHCGKCASTLVPVDYLPGHKGHADDVAMAEVSRLAAANEKCRERIRELVAENEQLRRALRRRAGGEGDQQ